MAIDNFLFFPTSENPCFEKPPLARVFNACLSLKLSKIEHTQKVIQASQEHKDVKDGVVIVDFF